MSKRNKITEILQHDISWYVDSSKVTELDCCAIEHIAYCINDGMSEGELCVSYGKDGSKEARGWWHIIDWKDIALNLYNCFEADKNVARQVAAMKRFDDAWTY